MIGKCPQCGDPRGDQGGMLCQANGCLLVDGDQRKDAEIARLKAEGAMLADKAAAAIRERDQAHAALAAGPAALRALRSDDYSPGYVAGVVEAAQKAAMKEKP